MSDEYRRVMAQLAEAEAGRRAEVKAALDWHSAELAARASATEEAEEAAAEALAGARRAAAVVSDVDREAAKLWEALRAHLGRGAGGRIGPVPVPAEDDAPPQRRLRSAADLIDRARHARPLPRWLYPVLPLVGAGCAALLYLLAQAILLLGDVTPGGAGLAIAVLGNVVVFLAPLSGLLAARYLAVREGSRFDGASVGPTVVGGLLAVSALIIALH